jgi:hypothetical protein
LLWLGLGLALVSAIAVNWAYAKEHDAAAQLPELTLRRPVESARLLLGAPAWLRAFGVETAGWLGYVGALRIAPLSLVQAVSAAGIGVLAFVAARGKIHQVPRRDAAAVLVAATGLLLLGLSLRGVHQEDSLPPVAGVVVWLGACGAAAVVVLRAFRAWVPAARFGLAGGLLFAAGDISAKLVGYGGWWLLVAVPLVAAYGLGTSMLQGGYQRGGALTTAGIATLTTDAVPIVAGFVLFDERLPHGASRVFQLAGFCSIVVSATLLGRR